MEPFGRRFGDCRCGFVDSVIDTTEGWNLSKHWWPTEVKSTPQILKFLRDTTAAAFRKLYAGFLLQAILFQTGRFIPGILTK